MIKTKKQALDFLNEKDMQTQGRHLWHHHNTFQQWVCEMLDEIFIEQDENILEKKFGKKAMQEIDEMCIGSTIGNKTIAGFVKYRNEIKKPIKTARPLKQFINEMIVIENAGIDLNTAIEIMQNNEWQSIKLEWVQKQLKSTKPIQSTDLKEFGF